VRSGEVFVLNTNATDILGGPGFNRTMVQRSVGMHYTIVNGTVINDQGRMTGDLPGHVLRGPLYRQQKAAA